MQDPGKKISEIIDALSRPLVFASKDGFSRIGAVKGLEGLVARLCLEAISRNPPGEMGEKFGELIDLFTGFDSLGAAEKKEKVSRAMELVGSMTCRGEEKPLTVGASGDRGGRGGREARDNLEWLRTPVEHVKGVGPRLAERLEKKGIATVEDLLYFLPLRYEDRRRIKKIKELTPGANEVVSAEVMVAGEARYGRRKTYEMVVSDGSGHLRVKWFNFRASYMKRYKPGQRLIIFGNVTSFAHQLEMIHPDIELADDSDSAAASIHFGSIVPIYSQLENLHQKTIRKIVRNAVEGYAGCNVAGTPPSVRSGHGLLDLPEAIRQAHIPPEDAPADGEPFTASLSKKSLAFDELFLLELGLALKRANLKKEAGIRFFSKDGRPEELERGLRALLPFKLTGAQERTLDEIRKDMGSPHPMNRLIQGDVGSGKTVVSLISSLWAIGSGFQAAVMAPTEILAEQHYLTTHAYSDALGIRTVLLTGKMPKKTREEALGGIRDGTVDMVIGTHALIQKDVEFNSLGLAVVDEQHRFGVVQRAALKKKGFAPDPENPASPDVLIMTATPIPRTLSMTVFGDLDVSIIDELPPGRKPVKTRLLKEKDRIRAYGLIREELASGGQAYIVYPLVEESEELSLRDATNMKEHLAADVFSDFTVGLLHGRMKFAEKEAVMRAFKAREIDVLVSTTVIEVGVDVPNASVMLIENAERFGLAQLHQLRGRVGRGERTSVCLLMAAWTNSPDTYRRLKVMETTQDGFRIAEEDLKIRGPGDFIGSRQSGLPDFRIAGALADLSLLKKARKEAFDYLKKNPGLKGDEAATVKEVLKSRWAGRLELAEIG